MWKLDDEIRVVQQEDDKTRCAVFERSLCRPCGGQHRGGQAGCWEATQGAEGTVSIPAGDDKAQKRPCGHFSDLFHFGCI